VVVVGQRADGEVDLGAVVANLAGRGWLEIYCEGGAAVATSLLHDDLVDRLVLHYGPVLVGGEGLGIGSLGVTSMDEARRWRTLQVVRLGSDAVMTLGRVGH
jgi:diaminohydroxyphosphoribosylaminopyrimidine deaminase/5-amino-6-(5-phosphoribosylamino)uracil reductase